MTPHIKILILNWNGKHLLKPCLDSVTAIDYPNYSVMVIDNGSTDNSVNMVKENYSEVNLLVLEKNYGFAGGYNRCFTRLKDEYSGFILLLNNDTILEPNTLHTLAKNADKYGDENIYGCKILNIKNNKIWYSGGKISFLTGNVYHEGINSDDALMDQPEINETDFVSGCCMLINSNLLYKVNCFTPNYNFYYEDVDLCNKAKKLGFAETNPISDLNGNDSAAKLRILSSLAFNKTISKNKILTEGIQNINITDILNAKNLGFKIKLLAISEIKNNKLIERVHPCLIKNDSDIAKVSGVQNVIIVDGFPIGRSVLQGKGAGPEATSSALISDLCSVLRGNIKYPFGVSYYSRKKIDKFDISQHKSSSYLRIEVKDIPGVLSSVTKAFANNNISIKNLIQVPDKKNKKASIAIITHVSSEKKFNKLLSILIRNKFILQKPTFIRIEKI